MRNHFRESPPISSGTIDGKKMQRGKHAHVIFHRALCGNVLVYTKHTLYLKTVTLPLHYVLTLELGSQEV